jgi:hypothetical protein
MNVLCWFDFGVAPVVEGDGANPRGHRGDVQRPERRSERRQRHGEIVGDRHQHCDRVHAEPLARRERGRASADCIPHSGRARR